MAQAKKEEAESETDEKSDDEGPKDEASSDKEILLRNRAKKEREQNEVLLSELEKGDLLSRSCA